MVTAWELRPRKTQAWNQPPEDALHFLLAMPILPLNPGLLLRQTCMEALAGSAGEAGCRSPLHNTPHPSSPSSAKDETHSLQLDLAWLDAATALRAQSGLPGGEHHPIFLPGQCFSTTTATQSTSKHRTIFPTVRIWSAKEVPWMWATGSQAPLLS